MLRICEVILLCLGMIDVTYGIHKRMTRDERLHAFQTSEENVQKYEVVPIHWPRVQKRNAEIGIGIHVKAFGEDIDLWLSPTDGMLVGFDTPVYTLLKRKSTLHFNKYPHLMRGLESYEDLKKAAVVVVSEPSQNHRRIVGTVGSNNLVIAPLPERLINEIKRQRRSIDNISQSDQDDYHYHIVYKRSASVGRTEYLGAAPTNATAAPSAAPPPIPDTVYPEILVVVSHDLFKKIGDKVMDTVAYVVAFWNGVDLKYRSLKNPTYRLNIAGIVITKNPEALTYIEQHESKENSSLAVYDALYASSDYWPQQNHSIPLESYDILVTMTSRQLCRHYPTSNDRDCGIGGISWTEGACGMRKMYQVETSKVSILRDSGGFDGIYAAAHELGHMLGANHDGEDYPDCPEKDGHIMNPTIPLNGSPNWSKCTLKDFQRFLNRNPACLYNNPIQRSVLPRYLPGKFMDADQQCLKFTGTKACNIDGRICSRLGCEIIGDSRFCRQILGGAADGTTCGPDMICLNGRCLEESQLFGY